MISDRSWAPTGLQTECDCAGEDQQQFTRLELNRIGVSGGRKGPVSEWVSARVTPIRAGVTSSSCRTPPLVEEDAPFQNT
jgi:hypothetical protein